MKKFLVVLFFMAAALPAQETLWLDLSGNWRMMCRNDPRYAAPGFDDSAWPTLTLPQRAHAFPRDATDCWMRRRSELPEAFPQEPLALSLGSIQAVYEIFVNGRSIGATGSMTSAADATIPRPRTFRIPPGVISGKAFLLAIHARPRLFMPPSWRIPDEGPYLLTDAAQAPSGAGAEAIERRWLSNVPALLFAVVFLVMALLALVAWRADSGRPELGWFAAVALSRGASNILLLWQLTLSSHPFSADGTATLRFFADTFQTPLFGQFAVATLGPRYRRWAWPIWICWCVQPLVLLFHPNNALGFFYDRYGTYIANIGSNLTILVMVLWDLYRLRGSVTKDSILLRFVLLLVPASWLDFWSTQALHREAFVSGELHFHRFVIAVEDLVWIALCATILALLLRRLAVDLRERRRLAGELEAARTVQQLLFPKPSVGNIDACYTPASEVGRDFWQALPAADGGEIVVVGDVSGKGLRAAMVVSLLTGALRNRKSDRPSEILSELNRVAASALDSGFVTAIVAHCRDGRVVLANAGHPPPYLNGEEVALESALPLGIVPEGVYAERELALSRQLTFVSDGVIEAANAKGELFGFERTAAISLKPAKTIAEAARAWGQNDDITVVTVRRTA